MPVYDSYAAVKRLVETGIPEEQAIAIVREQFTFVESLATKDDVRRLRDELTVMQKSSEIRLIKYFTGLAIAMSGAIVTLLKVL